MVPRLRDQVAGTEAQLGRNASVCGHSPKEGSRRPSKSAQRETSSGRWSSRSWRRRPTSWPKPRVDWKQQVEKGNADLRQANEQLQSQSAQRQRTERALRDSQAQYISLIDSLPVHVIRKDREGRFTFASRSFCELLGKTWDEIRGKTDLDLYERHLAEKYRQDDQRVMESKTKFETVEAHDLPDNGRIHVQIIKSPLLDVKGHRRRRADPVLGRHRSRGSRDRTSRERDAQAGDLRGGHGLHHLYG